jgi:protein SCO1/2
VTPSVAPKKTYEEGTPGYWRRRLGLRLVVLALGLAVVSGFGYIMRKNAPPPPLATYGHVPVFQLVDQSGAPFTDGNLDGHVSVVDFIFTRCAASCPRLTAKMAELQGRLPREGSGARLVSFSVDPENDTPPVLADYAKHAGADPARWSFVTGPVETLKAVVVSGFKVALEKLPTTKNGTNDYDVTHGDWFVLVDARGAIRGYYTTDDAKDVDRLVHDALRLEKGES